MKTRLIILSDIWGLQKKSWIDTYVKKLDSIYDIVTYDCCELGSVSKEPFEREPIRLQFAQGGLRRAVDKLVELEPNPVDVLGFSIGASIAWKAALEGMQVNNFYGISATRLRLETRKPEAKIKLVYGERDNFRPSREWIVLHGIKQEVLPNKTHSLYTESKFQDKICSEIVKGYLTSSAKMA